MNRIHMIRTGMTISAKTPLLHRLKDWLIACFCAVSVWPLATLAITTDEREQAQQHIQEILQHQDFQTRRKVTEWRYIESPDSPSDHSDSKGLSFADVLKELWKRLFDADEVDAQDKEDFMLPKGLLLWLAQFAEVLLWSVLLLGLSSLVWALYRHTDWRFLRRRADTVEAPSMNVNIVFEEGQPLPSQPAQIAWALWQQQQARAAISLLYRATLAHLREHEGLSLPDSATETECLRLIQRTQAAQRSHYCQRLTHTWLALAYAHQIPSDSIAQSLCEEWESQFMRVEA